MSNKTKNIAILGSVSIILVLGWKLFYFLCDDAYIAFRYVVNNLNGFGYTWNKSPFMPVEGYTSFLWVYVIDNIIRFTPFSIEAIPQIATLLSLILSLLSIFILYKLLLLSLEKKIKESTKYIYITISLLFVVVNKTFLVWSSSGLETAMFNFLIHLWLFFAIKFIKEDHLKTLYCACLVSSLIALTRPDGLLFVGTSTMIIGFVLITRKAKTYKVILFPILNLIPVGLHFLYRIIYYKALLPNTYYAKYSKPWPDAGIRYALSFTMEYFLFIPLLVIIFILIKKNKNIKLELNYKLILKLMFVMPIIGQLIYYTFIIGGDHFEYRVYSHIIPIIPLTTIYFLHKMKTSSKAIISTMLITIICSAYIPGFKYFKGKNYNKRENTFQFYLTTAENKPFFIKPYFKLYDSLQYYLIDHFICISQKEHKVFLEYLQNMFSPSKKFQNLIKKRKNPIIMAISVGYIGWLFQDGHIIDLLGLNDYVIARSKSMAQDNKNRYMAHNRIAPPQYINDLRPYIIIDGNGKITRYKNQKDLKDEEIINIEKKWYKKVSNQIK